MSDAYVIEISGDTAGIIAREHASHRFQFFAATHLFDPLEGRKFSTPREAESAARAHFVVHGRKRRLPSRRQGGQEGQLHAV